jgi:hypothetical protein
MTLMAQRPAPLASAKMVSCTDVILIETLLFSRVIIPVS